MRTLLLPSPCRRIYWAEGFPEYGTEYGATIRSIRQLEKDFPFLYYAGQYSATKVYSWYVPGRTEW